MNENCEQDLTVNKNPEESANKAHWTQHATFWTQAVLGLLGIGALCVYGSQLNEMKKTNNLTRESLYDSQRPWVAVEKEGTVRASQPYKRLADGTGTTTLMYPLENIGHTPAYVYVNSEFYALPETADLVGRAERKCKDFKRHPLTLLPGKPVEYGVAYDGGSSTDMTEHMPIIPPQEHGKFLLGVGCIVYQSTAGGEIRSTPFKVFLFPPESPGGRLVIQGPWMIGAAN